MIDDDDDADEAEPLPEVEEEQPEEPVASPVLCLFCGGPYDGVELRLPRPAPRMLSFVLDDAETLFYVPTVGMRGRKRADAYRVRYAPMHERKK